MKKNLLPGNIIYKNLEIPKTAKILKDKNGLEYYLSSIEKKNNTYIATLKDIKTKEFKQVQINKIEHLL